MSPHAGSARRSARTASSSAASLLDAYLTLHCRSLIGVDGALSGGDDTAIHDARVACRRVRSTLRVYGSLFEPGAARLLDGELRWWASALGPVRDLQVLQDRLDALVAEVDQGVPMDAVKTLIDDELRRDRLEHWATAQAALAGERHTSMLATVERWILAPPWTTKAWRPAKALLPMVERADHEVTLRLARANHSHDVDELHLARKAAKRARYATEVVAPVVGKRAAKDARRHERLQRLLGEHQDSVVSAELLRRLGTGDDAATRGCSFGLGLLYEREQQRARKARAAVRRAGHRHR